MIPTGIYLYSADLPKQFQARTVVEPQQAKSAPLSLGTDFSAQSSVQAMASFVGTSSVSDEAARQLGLRPGSLFGAATASADSGTGYVTITATASTARRATDTANAFAAALNSTRAKRGRQSAERAIQALQASLKATPRSQVDERSQIQQDLETLLALRDAQSQNVIVIQAAQRAVQISPHPRRNANIGVLLALFAGIALFRLAERMDRRLRDPDALERLTGRPFLGLIPDAAFEPGEATPDEREAFQTLRDSLTYFNADEGLESVLVCSALKGEGKTTVVASLARSYAALGKRVIVVDTDLRRPALAERLGIEAGSGLTDVLAGNQTLEEALVDVPPYGDALRVLPAGTLPANPSALLGSNRIKTLIGRLTADSDLVILDCAPLLVVSDAFPLLDEVSGIVGVARIERTPQAAIKRMVKLTDAAGATLLGYVATDAKAGALTGYGYGHGYGSEYGYVNP